MTTTSRMQYRRLGRSNVQLSVVGFGTCQLRNVPEPQAIATLLRGFELGVNWVHTSPDYCGAERIVARAIAESGRDVVMVSNGYGEMSHFRWLFDQTCQILGRDRLPVWGISCIDDAEFVGNDVWGKHGMVAWLAQLKREGRIDATFCTTHGAPAYVERLVECGEFDGIMLSYNPLGFHVLSYHAAAEGKQYEDLAASRARIFPLAARLGTGLLVMKPFAGGLLARSQAFPAKAEFAGTRDRPDPAAILQHILAEPGVTAVCPGTAHPDEAEANALAGHRVDAPTLPEAMELATTVSAMRATLCSRCGACETTCSHSLPVSWLFRDGYLWNTPSDLFEANTRQHYFHLHPQDVLTCARCDDQTCECPAGIDIPRELARVHTSMLERRAEGWLAATPAELQQPPLPGRLPARLVWSDVPTSVATDRLVQLRLWVENSGPAWWLVDLPRHDSQRGERVVMALFVDGQKVLEEPVRHEVEPTYRTHFACELRSPAWPCTPEVVFALLPPGANELPADATILLRRTLAVHDGPRPPAAVPAPSAAPSHPSPPLPPRPAPRRYGVAWLEHDLPAAARAGDVLSVRVRLRNDSSFAWLPDEPAGHTVDLAAFVDGVVTHTVKLPHVVPVRGEAVVQFALRLPLLPGPHALLLHLVEQGTATFPERGAAALAHSIELAPPEPGDDTGALWSTFATVDPWHYVPTQGIARLRDGTRMPVFAARATGCRITDSAGREYLDYTMGWGTTLLGYAHPEVTAALQAAASSGLTLAWPTTVEMEVAAMLRADIPCAEMAVFGKNGTDACTVAVRLCRVFTGRKHVLYCGYHGFGDWFAELRGFAQSGVPEHASRLVHRFRFLDLDDFRRLLAEHASDLACVMLEPSGPWGGNDRGFEPDCTPSFLREVAAATRAAGALLVFDEIITGYRYPGHSVQAAHGVVPDLACLGKALASGMPLSAVVGRRDVFESALPRCHYGPTFKGETLSFAAAKASITVCRREPVARHVWHYGERLRAGLLERCQRFGLAAAMTGPPFRMSLLLQEPDPQRRLLLRTLLQQELLRAGLSTYNGVMLPCYAHDDAALAETMERFEQAARAVACAVAADRVAERLELPPLVDL